MYTLDASLDPFAPHISAELVPAPVLGRVRAAASALPAELTERLCLECRLTEEDARTDLVIGVEAAGRAILSGENPAISLAPALTETGPWRQVRDFCHAWGDPASPLHGAVERLWLEFDISTHGDHAAPPVPGVFLDFTEEACGRGTADERCATVVDALRTLLGTELPPRLADNLHRATRALPEGAGIPYAGVLIPRGTELVRICVAGLGEERVADYLREAGWAGSYRAVRALLDRVRPTAGGAAPVMALLHLDVGSALLPRVGMEFAFARRPQLRGELPGAAFLDQLVERGSCTAAKRQGLVSWPGCAVAALPHQLWESVALRHLAHVKVVVDADGAEEAKAYLSLRHTPRVRR
ncbi:MAG TPA: hypothetical protein VK420_19380 [Longimicrobium sp.]|nr:hypothetical protein [Longimicrobium sp.]